MEPENDGFQKEFFSSRGVLFSTNFNDPRTSHLMWDIDDVYRDT